MLRLMTLSILLLSPVKLLAGYVEPAMGGGQVTQGEAGMKHADISFEGGRLSVVVDDTIGVPALRSLDQPFEFDPDGMWGMINQHAYNFQYGWNPSRFDAYPPQGTWIWIEQLEASPQLKTYQRPPASPEGLPIFGTDGSSTRWRWSGSMTHNLYAVAAPQLSEYYATYRVYIGHDSTGDPVPGFESADVTFSFTATPQLPGDYNLWRDNLGAPAGTLPNDPSGEAIGATQYVAWKSGLSAAPLGSGLHSAVVPEPGAGAFFLLAGGLFRGRASPCGTKSPSRQNCGKQQPPAL